jgi:hypothetical protein
MNSEVLEETEVEDPGFYNPYRQYVNFDAEEKQVESITV